MPSVDEIIAVNEERHRNRRALQNQATPILDFSEVNNENQPTSNNALIVSLERNLELSNQNSKAISLELQNSIKEKLFVKNAIIQNAIISNLPISQPPVNSPTPATPVENNVPSRNEKEQNKFFKTLSDYFLKPTRGNSSGSLLREGGSGFILSTLGLGGVDKAFNLSQKFANADLSLGNVKKKVSGATGLISSGADYITSRFSSVDKTKDENEKEDETRRENERESFQRFQENNNKKDDSFLPLLVSALLGGISLISGFLKTGLTDGLGKIATSIKDSFFKGFDILKTVLSKTWKVISEGLLKSFEGIGKIFKSVKDEIFKVPELINKGFEASKTMFSTVGEWLGKGKDFFSKGINKAGSLAKSGITKIAEGAGKFGSKAYNLGAKGFNLLPGSGLLKKGWNLGKKIGGIPLLGTAFSLGDVINGELNSNEFFGKDKNAPREVGEMYTAGGWNALTMGGFLGDAKKGQNKLSSFLDESIFGNYDTHADHLKTDNEKTDDENPPKLNIPKSTGSKAMNLADIAKKNITGGSGKCYASVWSDIQQAGLANTLNAHGGTKDWLGREQMNAFNFSEWADTKEGQSKMWKVGVNSKDKNLGLLPGDVVVFKKGWYAGNTAGHIEVVGRPNPKTGLMSGYSDHEDKNLHYLRNNMGAIRGVYRIKELTKTQLASKKPNVKKPKSKPPIKIASKPTNKMPTSQQLTEHEYGANGSSAVQEKTVNLSNNDPIINISQIVDSAKSSIQPQLKATENINDVRNYQGNNNSVDFSAFVESQNSFNSSILKILPTLGEGNNQSNNLQMSQTFSGDDPYFAIIQSFL